MTKISLLVLILLSGCSTFQKDPVIRHKISDGLPQCCVDDTCYSISESAKKKIKADIIRNAE